MGKIYIDYDNITDYSCYSVQDKDTIRAYETQPTINGNSNYTDFFINSHYLQKQGNQSWGNFSNLPSCISTDNITNNVLYRNDLDSILIIFFILLLVCFYFPYRIISRLFGRWLKW